MAESDHISTMTLRDYWRVVWLRRGWIIAIVVICTLLAYGKEAIQPPIYVASARLMYAPPPNVANGVVGNSTDLGLLSVEVQNVVNIVGTPAVRQLASRLLGQRSEPFSSISAIPASASSGTAVATVIDITAEASSAGAAARIANAYAQAIIELRKEREQQSWRDAQQIIQGQLDLYKTPQSRQTGEYAVLEQQLRNLQIAEASANGDFEIIVPATPPASPTSPKPMKWAVFGFIAGLFFGVVVAFVVSQFDTHVRSPEELVALLGMPLLGQLRMMPAKSLDREPLYVLSASNSPQAEAIRKLRANLEFTNVDGELKSVFFTSALQHEGKTTMVCNLAVALAEAGDRVVLVDGDLRRPRVHQYFGIRNAVGASTVLTGKTALEDALCPLPVGSKLSGAVGGAESSSNGQNHLSILTSGPLPPNPGEIIASMSFAALVARLESEFDIVVVDAPALLAVGDTAAMAPCVDGLVFLVDLNRARRPVLLTAASQISQMPCRKLGLVVVGKDSVLGYRQGHYYSHTEPSDVSVLVRPASHKGDKASAK